MRAFVVATLGLLAASMFLQRAAAESPANTTRVIHIAVPADAEIYVEGRSEGQKVEWTRRLPVHAGEHVAISVSNAPVAASNAPVPSQSAASAYAPNASALISTQAGLSSSPEYPVHAFSEETNENFNFSGW
jgi:hypothetical protein